jgi:hypothetical protein
MESTIRVTLEHVISAKDTPQSLELAGVTLELPISTFIIGSKTDVQGVPGTPVLGLIRRTGNGPTTYDLHREAKALPMASDNADSEVLHRMFRVTLFDPDGTTSELSACYPLEDEFPVEVEEDPMTFSWWFLVKREGEPPGPYAYHLIYLFEEDTPAGSPGGVQAYLMATKTDCQSRNYFHRLRCRLYRR